MEGAEMNDDINPGATPVELATQDPFGPKSLAEQLRAKREDVATNRDTLIQVIGYEELQLQTKHRLMDRKEIELIGKMVIKETKDRGDRNMLIMVDQIIQSTLTFVVQPPTIKTTVQLMHEDGVTKIERWDQLAEYLGWNPTGTAREALYYVFGDNEFAIGQYGIRLNRWMGNTSSDVDLELLGEAG